MKKVVRKANFLATTLAILVTSVLTLSGTGLVEELNSIPEPAMLPATSEPTVESLPKPTAESMLARVQDADTPYTLKEFDPPGGYAAASPITFEMNRDGDEKTVSMRDAPLKARDLPKASDNNELALWFGILAGSLTLLIAVVIAARKRRVAQ